MALVRGNKNINIHIFVATNINYAKLIIVDVIEVAKVDSYI